MQKQPKPAKNVKNKKAAKPAETDIQRAERRALRSITHDQACLTAGRTAFADTSGRDNAFLACYAAVSDASGHVKLAVLASKFPGGVPFHTTSAGKHPKATDGGVLNRTVKSGNATRHDGGGIMLSKNSLQRGRRLLREYTAADAQS